MLGDMHKLYSRYHFAAEILTIPQLKEITSRPELDKLSPSPTQRQVGLKIISGPSPLSSDLNRTKIRDENEESLSDLIHAQMVCREASASSSTQVVP
jgi:hypothetical protein